MASLRIVQRLLKRRMIVKSDIEDNEIRLLPVTNDEFDDDEDGVEKDDVEKDGEPN